MNDINVITTGYLARERVGATLEVQHHALQELINAYVQLAESGDCGDWDPEYDKVVIEARIALALRRS